MTCGRFTAELNHWPTRRTAKLVRNSSPKPLPDTPPAAYHLGVIEVRGSVKRTQRNELIAELNWDDCQKVIQSNLSRYGAGTQISVSGAEYTVVTTGQRFKSNGFAKGYVYLAEPQPETTPVSTIGLAGDQFDADVLEEMGDPSAALVAREAGSGVPA